MNDGTQSQSWPVKLSDSGRIVLPKELRELTGWERGTELIVHQNEQGSLEIKSLDEFIAGVQEYFASKFGPDRSLVDELIEERRQEAIREERDS